MEADGQFGRKVISEFTFSRPPPSMIRVEQSCNELHSLEITAGKTVRSNDLRLLWVGPCFKCYGAIFC